MEETEVADDLLTRGWAAPAALDPDPLATIARLESLGVAQRNEILRQAALIAELGHRLVLAEKERDEALQAVARERLDALTRANHARRSLADRFGWWAR
jgi:hypothetical protein